MKQLHKVEQNNFQNKPASNPNSNLALGFFWVSKNQLFPIQLLPSQANHT